MFLSINSSTSCHQEKPECYAFQKAIGFSRSYANDFSDDITSSDPYGENEWQMKEGGKDETDWK